MIFITYFIVPELRNIHGFILQRYSGLTFIGCTLVLITILIKKDAMGEFICFACGITYLNCITKQSMQYTNLLRMSVHLSGLILFDNLNT